jgi:hypothetical protein
MKSRSDGLILIALYHFISGLISLLGICATFSVPLIVGLAATSSRDPDAGTATAIVGVIGLLVAGILLVITAANWVVGWGLWGRREWARLAALAMAILRLVNIPLGTVIGGLIIWYLLQDSTKAEF